jgi:hypothetical protein
MKWWGCCMKPTSQRKTRTETVIRTEKSESAARVGKLRSGWLTERESVALSWA